MNLLIYPDKGLTTECEPITVFGPEVSQLTDNLAKVLVDAGGLGLAAPQIAVLQRAFVCQIGSIDIMHFVNPEIVEILDKEGITVNEGCLSLPTLNARVKRYNWIRIRAFSPLGEEFFMALYGDDAIVFQHELDHLDGITLFERMDRVQRLTKLNSYKKKVKRIIARSK